VRIFPSRWLEQKSKLRLKIGRPSESVIWM